MAFQLSDIYIGDFPITQNFGAHPEVYSARFGLKGHNGTDIGCPTNTLILAAADGVVLETGFDTNGYGNYIKLKHDGYITLYGHLNDLTVANGDKVVKGQLIAHSNDSGFSDGPHLHFGVAPCDGAGVKTEQNNGYSGYIDVMGDRCQWTITNSTAPVSTSLPIPSEELMSNVTISLYAKLVGKSTNWDNVAKNLNLSDQDIDNPDGAYTVAIPKIQVLRDQITSLNRQLLEARASMSTTTITDTTEASVAPSVDSLATQPDIIPIDTTDLTTNPSFLVILLRTVKSFILK